MKKKKNVRNKARDVIGDYYLTNRQIGKENEAKREKKGREPFSQREKFMLGVAIVLLIAVFVKYVIL